MAVQHDPMMRRKIVDLNGKFLWEWFLVFEKSRISNEQIVRDTLAAFSSIPKAAGSSKDIQAFTGGWAPKSSEVRSLWFWFGIVYRERRKLSHFFKEGPINLEWIIANDRRTGVIGNRQALSELTRSACHPAHESLLGKVGSAYVVFTPNLLALPCSESERGIYHLSYLSLFVIPLVRPICFARELIAILYDVPREARKTWNFLKCCALSASFITIDSTIQLTRMTLLTSNSFVDEMMRYVFLRAHPDRIVNEILHGIPSIPLDDYHKHMGTVIGPSFEWRMKFISPFQSVQPFSFLSIKPKERAINLRINKLLNSPVLGQILSESLKLKLDAGQAMIVAINGAGNLINERFTASTLFQVELDILKWVREVARRRRVDIICLYSIHPEHYRSAEAEKIADALGSTLVIKDSLTTWLVADICISLFSGAAWEAAEFGSKSLISVRPSDHVFDRCVYSKVSFPLRDESFFDCIERTIMETQVGPIGTPEERFIRIFTRDVLRAQRGIPSL